MGLDGSIAIRHGERLSIFARFNLPLLGTAFVIVSLALPSSTFAQGSLEKNVNVKGGRLNFETGKQIEVLLKLPDNYIINNQVPTVVELRSRDGGYQKKAALAVGSNSIDIGDVSKFVELEGHAMVFYCEESETSRCFLKKPKVRLVHSAGPESSEPLAITVLPH